jgi:uncharacterized glyoxalase superfamily protein PhnB
MTAGVGAIVMSTTRTSQVVAFYRSLGIPLVEEDHGDGIVHWACELGDVHFAVFEAAGSGHAPGYHEPGSTFCGFVVDDVRSAVELLRSSSTIVQEPIEMPWGLRAVVVDPDGRPVEVFER